MSGSQTSGVRWSRRSRGCRAWALVSTLKASHLNLEAAACLFRYLMPPMRHRNVPLTNGCGPHAGRQIPCTQELETMRSMRTSRVQLQNSKSVNMAWLASVFTFCTTNLICRQWQQSCPAALPKSVVKLGAGTESSQSMALRHGA